jgi:tRNA threonylcarbamoyladenosine biosynthesis protein TsaB
VNILAIDTATDILSLAIGTEQGQWYIEANNGLHHSEQLLPLIENLCSVAAIKAQDLSLLLCMEGPGSFTGLRIGFATVKGMALALGIPYQAVPTLDCMAYSQKTWSGLILPVLDAKKRHFFTAFYHQETRLSDYLDIPFDEIVLHFPHEFSSETPLILTGPAAPLVYEKFSASNYRVQCIVDGQYQYGKARELLTLGEKLYIIRGTGMVDDAGPLYLRQSDAELAKESL